MSTDTWYSRYLPFAGAPTVVRANQKDDYFVDALTSQLVEMLRSFKGSLFVHNHSPDIKMLGKLLYYAITTGVGARTLGEEYVDLNYVTRDGKRRVGIVRRVLFVISYVLIPYLISKVKNQVGNGKWKRILNKLTFFNVLDAMNLHLALFYFTGKYYQVSKRLFGMRYVLNYNPDQNSGRNKGNYEIIGGVMMLQLILKYSGWVKNNLQHLWNNEDDKSSQINSKERLERLRDSMLRGEFTQLIKMGSADEDDDDNNSNNNNNNNNSHEDHAKTISEKDSVDQQEFEVTIIDLADAAQLPYLPDQSRSCMLCLSPMKDPSCTACGHLFCWGCIQNWCRERTECPLCRAPVAASQTLPLR